MQVDFRSDNVAGVAPENLEAIARANSGTDLSYGSDAITARLQDRFSELFGRRCYVQPVGTGTATNALSLALLTPPWGAVLCSEVAHVADSECGAGELFTGGAKIQGLPHRLGKLDPNALEASLAGAGWGKTSSAQPALLSLTQGTEKGTVYTAAELEALTATARRYKLRLHMDGARFANAVAALGCAPGDLTWKLGIDVLSFGATKNGCLGAEAILTFDESLVMPLRFRARKAGHVPSKMRFVSAQLEAYLADGLWLRLAGHANAMARRLAQGLGDLPGARLLHPVEINEIFCELPAAVRDGLAAAGFGFYGRTGDEVRLVTAFSTTEGEIDAFLAEARRHAASAPRR
jgi:threonine aldolase